MEKTDNLNLLEEVALDLGAADVKVIPIDQVVVEDRVRLRCLVGCPYYGKGLRCPPFTPSVKEFRKMLLDYKFAMIVKFKPLKTSKEILEKYNINTGEESNRLRDQYNDIDKLSPKLWSDYSTTYKKFLTDLLEMERAAFNLGYTLATAFFAGRCLLCRECNVKNGKCRNPMISRFSAEAMGINLLKTSKNSGMELKFNPKKDVTPIAILLID